MTVEYSSIHSSNTTNLTSIFTPEEHQRNERRQCISFTVSHIWEIQAYKMLNKQKVILTLVSVLWM